MLEVTPIAFIGMKEISTVIGMVQGVTQHGELILVSGGVARTYSSGEVILRLLA